MWVEGQITLSQLHWMEGEREGFTRNFDEALRLLARLDQSVGETTVTTIITLFSGSMRSISSLNSR